MSQIDDGGPAFPHDNQELGNRHRIAQPGMSLRDWFAGQALLGLLAREDADIDQVTGPKYIIPMAFEYADAMLAYRKTGGEE